MASVEVGVVRREQMIRRRRWRWTVKVEFSLARLKQCNIQTPTSPLSLQMRVGHVIREDHGNQGHKNGNMYKNFNSTNMKSVIQRDASWLFTWILLFRYNSCRTLVLTELCGKAN